MTRVLSWNILQGGGKRAEAIAASILGHRPDIVALQEYRQNASAPIREALRRAGLVYQFTAEAEASANTLFIASRTPVEAGDFMPEREGICHLVEAETDGLTLLVAHFPQKEAQKPLFEMLIADTPSLVEGPALLVGDLNCGIPFSDSDSKTFVNTALFQRLLELGWIDAWRSRAGQDAREFTWVSPRTGNRFRYDHCLASPAADKRIAACQFDHAARETGLSDHSALIVDL